MQIESLAVFCDLAETKSFTKAAHIHGITQSAVSQQITAMERQFKSPLIERSKKQFRLTREGQVLYEFSKQIVQTYQGLHSQLQEIKELISGTVRVAAIYSIGLHDLPPYLTKYLKAYPSVNAHVEYERADRVYEEVMSNVVDLGLVAFPWKHPQVEIVPLRKDPMVLICSPRHPLAKSKRVKVQAVAQEHFIEFEPDMPSRKAIDKVLKEHGIRVVPVMEFDNIETVKRAVEIESGVAIVPRSAVAQEVAGQTLAQVEFEDANFERVTAIIYKKNKLLSPAMKQFIAVLKEGC